VTLVDSSVWVDHFRRGNLALGRLLEAGEVVMHPLVLGELALAGLPDRARTLNLLRALPVTGQTPDEAVLHAIEHHRWWSTGIGWVDAHLLTATLIESVSLWTLDRRLARLAISLGAGFQR
jgi:predicted nucleic acid-binding protein